jgi:hypothetical protein
MTWEQDRPLELEWCQHTDLAKTMSSMPVLNKVLGIETPPGFELPKAAIAIANSAPGLYWKCTNLTIRFTF